MCEVEADVWPSWYPHAGLGGNDLDEDGDDGGVVGEVAHDPEDVHALGSWIHYKSMRVRWYADSQYMCLSKIWNILIYNKW